MAIINIKTLSVKQYSELRECANEFNFYKDLNYSLYKYLLKKNTCLELIEELREHASVENVNNLVTCMRQNDISFTIGEE